jgi:hypothetical protein
MRGSCDDEAKKLADVEERSNRLVPIYFCASSVTKNIICMPKGSGTLSFVDILTCLSEIGEWSQGDYAIDASPWLRRNALRYTLATAAVGGFCLRMSDMADVPDEVWNANELEIHVNKDSVVMVADNKTIFATGGVRIEARRRKRKRKRSRSR